MVEVNVDRLFMRPPAVFTAAWLCIVLYVFALGLQADEPSETPNPGIPNKSQVETTPADSNDKEPSKEQIEKWVSQLDSDRFLERRRATEYLILARSAAIDPLVTAIDGGSLETVSRSVFILRELAVSTDYDVETKAYEALESVSKNAATLGGRRARRALTNLAEIRSKRAREYLVAKGAVIAQDRVRVGEKIDQPFECVIFGENWQGKAEDLRHLKWVVGSQSLQNAIYAEPAWLLTFRGSQMTDDYLEQLRGLEHVVAVKIRKTKITEIGIAHLKELKGLRFVDVLYNPLGEAALQHFAEIEKLGRMRLFGTQLPAAGIDELRKKLKDSEIDARAGAFLGISCTDKPCRVTLVADQTAAAKAGIQIEDVIVAYDGKPIDSFDQLTDLIGRNAPGDTVPLDIQRLGNKKTLKVTLGEWN